MSQFVSQSEYNALRRDWAGFPAWLAIVHSNPFRADAGGTERHVLDLMAALGFPRTLLAYREEGAIIVVEFFSADPARRIFHRFPLRDSPPRVCLEWPAVEEAMETILDCMGVGLVHIHHLFHWPVRIWRSFERRGIPFFFTVHDFYCVCPNNNLLDCSRQTLCSCVLDPGETRGCLRAWRKTNGEFTAPWNERSVQRHRHEFGALLAAASGVICPSEKTRTIIRRFHSGRELRLRVVPHGMDGGSRIAEPRRPAGAPLRVGVVGSVSQPWKGAANHLRLVELTRNHPLEWHFFGDLGAYGYRTRLERASSAVVIHGAYERARLAGLLEKHAIEVVAMAPSVHETFSFTLSEVLCAGVPAVATRMGACEERLETAGLSDCLVDDAAQAAELLINLARHRECLSALRARLRLFRHETVAGMAERMRAVYGEAEHIPRRAGPVAAECEGRAYEAYCAARERADADRFAVVSVDHSQGPWWYRLGRHLENIVPAAIQRPLRSYFMRKRWILLAQIGAHEIAAAAGEGVELLRRPFGRMVFRTTGPHACLNLQVPGMEPREVGFMRLRIRTRIPRVICARLSWVHDEQEEFCEANSIEIALEEMGRWQDVLIDLRSRPIQERWVGEGKIRRLRLEVPAYPGGFEVDSLVLARPR